MEIGPVEVQLQGSDDPKAVIRTVLAAKASFRVKAAKGEERIKAIDVS